VVLCAACFVGGCAFGDRKVAIDYKPVMTIKAYRPLAVEVRPF
jgi:hypothetical protein